MEKITKSDLIVKGIIALNEKFVPELVLKKHFSRKLIDGIPDSVFKAHITCVYGCEDLPILDPLLFFIPAFAKDPSLAACQLLESIRNNVDDDDIRSYIFTKEHKAFMRLLERTNWETKAKKEKRKK